jgi:phosphatidylglycerophosphatase A
MNHPIRFLATAGYLGTSPKAPGTVGTLGAFPFVYLLLSQTTPVVYMGVSFLFVLGAVLVCHFYEAEKKTHDSQEVVIDEWAGFLVTMTWLPVTWQSFVLGFLLFRVLDIFKPPPIRWIDQKVKGGLGVVADDIAAGLIANFILQLLYTHTTILGFQLN